MGHPCDGNNDVGCGSNRCCRSSNGRGGWTDEQTNDNDDDDDDVVVVVWDSRSIDDIPLFHIVVVDFVIDSVHIIIRGIVNKWGIVNKIMMYPWAVF